jgi:transmembrane sensor
MSNMKEERFWILLGRKICDEITAEELLEFQLLVNENPEWEKAYDVLQEFWASNPKLRPIYSSQAEEAYLLHVRSLKEKVSDFPGSSIKYEQSDNSDILKSITPWYKNWKTYSAVLILGIVFFFGYRLFDKKTKDVSLTAVTNQPSNEIKVTNGSRSKIELPDGTEVWINSGSKLTYGNSFKEKTREVVLDGEAYFDVKKDPSRPFIVHTNGIDVKVLGTVFNVKAYDKEPTIETSLIHGSVEVSKVNEPNAPKVMLRPNEKLVYDKTKKEILGDDRNEIQKEEVVQQKEKSAITIKPIKRTVADNAIKEIAWVYNRLVFEDEKFTDLAIKMERWFNVEIDIKSNRLKNISITGSFEDETIEEALQGLQYLVSFKYEMVGQKVVIVN